VTPDIDGDAYLVRLGCTPDQTDDGLTIIEELEDVFTLHGTVPTQAKVLNGDFGDAFSAIVSTELPENTLGRRSKTLARYMIPPCRMSLRMSLTSLPVSLVMRKLMSCCREHPVWRNTAKAMKNLQKSIRRSG